MKYAKAKISDTGPKKTVSESVRVWFKVLRDVLQALGMLGEILDGICAKKALLDRIM